MLKNILGLVLFLGFWGCYQDEKDTLVSLQENYSELTELNNDLDQQRSELFKLIREYNSTHADSADQFDIASIDTLLGASEKDLLRGMFKEEKDISYNGLLSTIIGKNDEIRELNDKIIGLNDQIVSLENKLPKAYVVQRGDTHYKIVRDFLVNQHGMDLKQAKEIAWKTVMTDNLLPGNRIWLSYDKEQSIIGTFVTQGDAKIAPMRYEQIAKKQMIQRAVEKANASISNVSIQSSNIQTSSASL